MANTGFVVNANRIDPYKAYKFRILWDFKNDNNPLPVLGVTKVGSLKRTTEVIKHKEGGDNGIERKMPGRTTWDAITCERGITHDTAFESWANMVHQSAGDPAMDLANFRKELILEVLNEKGHVAHRYFLHRCWVSEFSATPGLDANTSAIAVESIKIELEGWERDPQDKEPKETDPVPAQP